MTASTRRPVDQALRGRPEVDRTPGRPCPAEPAVSGRGSRPRSRSCGARDPTPRRRCRRARSPIARRAARSRRSSSASRSRNGCATSRSGSSWHRPLREPQETGPEPVPGAVAERDELVVDERPQQPVCGRAAEAGGLHDLGEAAGAVLDGVEHGDARSRTPTPVSRSPASATVMFHIVVPQFHHMEQPSAPERRTEPGDVDDTESTGGEASAPRTLTLRRRCGSATSSTAPTASPTSSTSICISSTRSRRRRRSTACACTAGPSAVPTSPSRPWTTTCPPRPGPITDPISRRQIEALATNAKEFGVTLHPMGSPGQGIVHVIGPEQGYTQPGLVIVCGDSHTSTHGAFGALAFGIGTSEVEHVLATQTLPQNRPGTMAVTVEGDLPGGRLREGRHPGHHQPHRHRRGRRPRRRVPRLRDPRALHGGAHDGLQHVDRGRARAPAWSRPTTPRSPTSRAARTRRGVADWERALEDWRALPTDPGATFDREVRLDAAELKPYVSWGTNPAQSVTIDGEVPDPDSLRRARQARGRRPEPWRTWISRPARRCARSAPTRSSSAAARTRGWRICASRPRSSAGARWPPACARWSSPAPSP